MRSVDDLAAELDTTLRDRMSDKPRALIALAGPPGAGKSTLADALVNRLNASLPDAPAVAVPMDGFHYDNLILDARGLRARKGTPETFDASGFLALLHRLRIATDDVAIPVFDRASDLSRASARMIEPRHRLLVVEGNYLLLDRPIWRDLRPLFDLKIMLRPSLEVIEARLVQRWLDHGHPRDEAIAKARGNDLANAELILSESGSADLTLQD
ncbi:MAG: nucleoside triphosphate hydrolase [Alphaproteobacteria bacterium]